MSQTQKDSFRYWSLAGPIWSILAAIVAFASWTAKNQATNDQLWKQQLQLNQKIEIRLTDSETSFRSHQLDYIALTQCLQNKGIRPIR